MLSFLGAVGVFLGVSGGIVGISYGIYAGATAIRKVFNLK